MELKVKAILHKKYNLNKNKSFFYDVNDTIAYDYLVDKYNITEDDDKTILYHILYLDYSQYYNKLGNFHLVISLYNEKNISRSLELLLCLCMNFKNKYISKIYILQEFIKSENIDDNFTLVSEVIYLLKNNSSIRSLNIDYSYERPSFQKIFDFCNENINGPVIVSNSDILYDDTLSKIVNLKNEHFLSISRNNKTQVNGNIKWDTIKIPIQNFFLDNIFSQDTWVFHSPLKNPLKIDINLGEMFSDSYLNYKLSKTNYECYNLSKDINCLHIQEGDSTSDIVSRDQKLINQKLNIIYEKENGYKDILIGLKISEIDDFYKNINSNQFITNYDYVKEYY